MTSNRRSPRATFACSILCAAVVLGACAPRLSLLDDRQRPAALVGEWIDLSHTTPVDTALWVLRGDGYDGAAHLRVMTTSGDGTRVERTEKRYGSWYFDGVLADSTHRAVCFARRIGRDGATCLPFRVDTTEVNGAPRRRLTVENYQGEHRQGTRTLIERAGARDTGGNQQIHTP